jgi:hypothetical protein
MSDMPGKKSFSNEPECSAANPQVETVIKAPTLAGQGKLDRGRIFNHISPTGIASGNCVLQAKSRYLVEVEKVTLVQMEEIVS